MEVNHELFQASTAVIIMTRSAALALKKLGFTTGFEIMSLDEDPGLHAFQSSEELAKQCEMFPDLPGTEAMVRLRAALLGYAETPRPRRKLVEAKVVCVFNGKAYVVFRDSILVVALPK